MFVIWLQLLKFVLHNQTADVRAALQKGADANLIDRDVQLFTYFYLCFSFHS
jgi:hypothetical protein